MAKKDLNKKQATSITTRIDFTAKEIINRSGNSYRQILEDAAYSSISKDNVEPNVVSPEELKELKDDISLITSNLKKNEANIQIVESMLQELKENNIKLRERLDIKQSRLDGINDSIFKLEEIKEEYSDEIVYGIQDATAKVLEVLKHNAELRRKYGPRNRVKEQEIKRICVEYKVTLKEVFKRIDPKYQECMDGFEKYI